MLVVGAIVGADVYIVAAMGAAFLGPAQLVAWLAAGVLAALIALAFVQCAAIDPDVGGSFAYARAAGGPLVGFLAGWALYVGEWIALPVFPLAFVNYLGYFIPHLSAPFGALIKALLIAAVTSVNVVSVRASGRANDVLTIAKLLPLAILVLAALAFTLAHPSTAVRNLTPFAPLGWERFGSAVLLIFWAYAGFELAVLPASEVERPQSTLPQGLIIGMAIATLFYLLTAFAVVVALPWQVAASSPRPLVDALEAILRGLGFPSPLALGLMSLGALASILGVYDVFTLSLAWLGYAMARDGMFPPWFARIHPRFGTPHVALLFQAVAAVVAALLLDLANLIGAAVFFLGLCYLLTALAALRLLSRSPGRALQVPGLRILLVLAALSGGYLSAQAPLATIGAGTTVMVLGTVMYVGFQKAWQPAMPPSTAGRPETLPFEQWARQREKWLLRWLSRT